ncbi:hypothetical protein ACQP3J_33080, partial [Escherichia coli]
ITAQELSDNSLITLSKMEIKEQKDKDEENMTHLFRIIQSLMEVTDQEAELALENLNSLEKDKQILKIN